MANLVCQSCSLTYYLIPGAGYAIVIVNIIVTMYYNVIISYPLLFLVNSLRNKLPWVDCDNPWNTENCLKVSDH